MKSIVHTTLLQCEEFAHTIERLCLQWKCHIDTELSIQTNARERTSEFVNKGFREVIESLAICMTQSRLPFSKITTNVLHIHTHSLSRILILYSNFNRNVFKSNRCDRNFYYTYNNKFPLMRIKFLSHRNFISCFNQLFIISNFT